MNDSTENLLPLSLKKDEEEGSPQRRSCIRINPWLLHLILFCIWIILFSRLLHQTLVPESDDRVAIYSPASEAVQYHKVLFNGTLTFPSIYRGIPTPELNAAWDTIDTVSSISITSEELLKIGKEARPSLVKYRDQDGGGYVAALEFSHQLHCLNMLRMYTYSDYYEPPKEDPKLYRDHLDHCIEILRQFIMCAGDVGLVTFDWVEGHRNPWPDFNTWHQCRDFEKLRVWHEEHAIAPQDGYSRTEDTIPLAEAP